MMTMVASSQAVQTVTALTRAQAALSKVGSIEGTVIRKRAPAAKGRAVAVLVRAATALEKVYDPNEPRDVAGKWTRYTSEDGGPTTTGGRGYTTGDHLANIRWDQMNKDERIQRAADIMLQFQVAADDLDDGIAGKASRQLEHWNSMATEHQRMQSIAAYHENALNAVEDREEARDLNYSRNGVSLGGRNYRNERDQRRSETERLIEAGKAQRYRNATDIAAQSLEASGATKEGFIARLAPTSSLTGWNATISDISETVAGFARGVGTIITLVNAISGNRSPDTVIQTGEAVGALSRLAGSLSAATRANDLPTLETSVRAASKAAKDLHTGLDRIHTAAGTEIPAAHAAIEAKVEEVQAHLKQTLDNAEQALNESELGRALVTGAHRTHFELTGGTIKPATPERKIPSNILYQPRPRASQGPAPYKAVTPVPVPTGLPQPKANAPSTLPYRGTQMITPSWSSPTFRVSPTASAEAQRLRAEQDRVRAAADKALRSAKAK